MDSPKNELNSEVDTNRKKKRKRKFQTIGFPKQKRAGILVLCVSTLDLDARGQGSSAAEWEILGTDCTVDPRRSGCGFLHGP